MSEEIQETKPTRKAKVAEPTVVEVEYLAPINTSLFIGGTMIEFVDGKATVSAEDAKMLKDAGHIK